MEFLVYFKIVFVIISIVFERGRSFNVDTRYPIIISKFSNSPDYFGASVNLLRNDVGHSWVIIGQPKGNSSEDAHRDIVEPGVIWRCSIWPQPETCRPVLMDDSENYHEYYDPVEGVNVSEYKTGSWLGGSTALDSDNFIACASKWENRQKNESKTLMDGMCYKRPTSDLFRSPIPPPSGRYLHPLADPKLDHKGNWRSGQAGFSVHLPKTRNEVIMGAPGGNRWRGSVIQYLSSGEGSEFRKSFIYKPQDSVPTFSYLGYSVSSGFFFNTGGNRGGSTQGPQVQYVAGAPRAHALAGKVTLFQIPPGGDDQLQVFWDSHGDQVGSYFGASLLVLDVNGDGFDDLLVGAPRFNRDLVRTKGRGGGLLSEALTMKPLLQYEKYEGAGDEGAVYLYLSTGSSLSRSNNLLNGDNKPWSQFGTALCALGDLNKDGYNDFAISAPFGGDSGGAVYIFHGTAKAESLQTYSQVIRAKQIDSGLSGFGFSLSGSVDIDNNQYNDLAIGSFNSSQIVLLRSKPIITVLGKVSSSTKQLPLNIQAFEVKSCVSYQGENAPKSILLGVKLQADATVRPRRVEVQFADQRASPIDKVEYTEEVGWQEEKCTTFVARVIDDALESSSAPVVFRQEVFIPNERDSGGIGVRPRKRNIRLDGSHEVLGEFFSSFCATCPVINLGKPRTFDLELPLGVDCGDDKVCEADLKLNVIFRDTPDTGFVIGSKPSLFMDVEMSNYKDPAIAPALLITWSHIKLRRNTTDCSILAEEGLLTTYRCRLGKLLDGGGSASASLEFDTSTMEFPPPQNQLVFTVTAVTASNLVQPETKNMILPLVGQADLFVTGTKVLEYYNPAMKSPFLVFQQTFEIGLEGLSTVKDIRVLFTLPVQLKASDELVVNVRGVVPNGKVDCQPTKGSFAKSTDIRDTVDVEDNDEELPDIDYGGIGGLLPKEKDVPRKSNSTLVENDKLLLHCSSPFVDCIEVTCKIESLTSGGFASILFPMDMNTETIRSLLEKHGASSIHVESTGALLLTDEMKAIQPQPPRNKPDESVSATLIEREGYKPISKWIFILAVVIGLLILACVVFCLYACGCFERKRPGEEDAVDGDAEEMVPLQKKPSTDQVDNADSTSPSQDVNLRVTSPIYPSANTPPNFIPPEQPTTNVEEGEGRNENN